MPSFNWCRHVLIWNKKLKWIRIIPRLQNRIITSLAWCYHQKKKITFFHYFVQLQKISIDNIPTSWKVTGNSKGWDSVINSKRLWEKCEAKKNTLFSRGEEENWGSNQNHGKRYTMTWNIFENADVHVHVHLETYNCWSVHYNSNNNSSKVSFSWYINSSEWQLVDIERSERPKTNSCSFHCCQSS